MLSKRENLQGKKFGQLFILSFEKVEKKHTKWKCKCECGKVKIIDATHLKSGATQSCGCLRKRKGRNKTHGLAHTRFWRTWQSMLLRCQNKNDTAYPRYGGRGVAVCERWQKFENFRDDMYETYLAHVKEYGEKNTTIERIDNNGNYEPINCRWATMKEQANNRRTTRLLTFQEREQSLTDWAKELNIPRGTLWDRIHKKLPLEKVFTSNKSFEGHICSALCEKSRAHVL